MEIFSRTSIGFVKIESLLSELIVPQAELPKKIFKSKLNRLLSFDGNFIRAANSDFFEKIVSFLKEINEEDFYLWSYYPAREYFPHLPVLRFFIDENKWVFNDMFKIPLTYSLDNNGKRIYISFHGLTSMNVIVFNKSLNWLIYCDYSTDIGLFAFNEPQIKDKFMSSFNEYLFTRSEIMAMAESFYNYENYFIFKENYAKSFDY